MKRPGFSLGSVLLVVFAVAADCMAMRAIQSRPIQGQGVLAITLLGTLPMANVLAVVTTLLLWRRRTPSAFRLGFVVGGVLAVAVTVLGTRPGLDWLETSLASSALGAWIAPRPFVGWVVGYLGLPGLALLFQLLSGVIVGALAKRVATGGETVARDDAPRRLRLAEALTMMFLIAAPALVVEGTQRWTTDPTSARMAAGGRAVVDIRVMNGCRVAIEDGPTFLLANGSEVEVDDDSQPSTVAGVMTPRGEQFGDHRDVRVTLRDGEHAGARTSVPRQFLRIVPSSSAVARRAEFKGPTGASPAGP